MSQRRRCNVEDIKPTIKKCRSCGKFKPLDEFGTHKDTVDGRQSYCKKCRNALHGKRRKEDPAFYFVHHIATRVRKQVGDDGLPPNFTRDIQKYTGWTGAQLVRSLNADIWEREGITLKEALARGYHLDHRQPLSSFQVGLVTDDAFKACWSLENLWMLSAEANLAKGASTDYDFFDAPESGAKGRQKAHPSGVLGDRGDSTVVDLRGVVSVFHELPASPPSCIRLVHEKLTNGANLPGGDLAALPLSHLGNRLLGNR